MIKKYIGLLSIVCTIMIAFTNCGGNQNKATDLLSDTLLDSEIAMEPEMIAGIITSVPNPVEMSVLLNESGVVYSADLLNSPSNVGKYSTNFKKALNLGVYGTDLVHMNIYGRTVSSVLYLKNIKSLAEDLSLSQFFDYETLNRLSENNQNIDSVLLITSLGFNNMSNFLVEQERSSIAILIAYGTWIETLHLATNVEKVSNKEAVHTRLGEQKVVMENIMMLLQAFKNQEEFDQLYKDAVKLKEQFDKVTIEYHYAPPEQKEIDGELVIIDNSTSIVNINDDVVESISKEVSNIRSQIIQ